MKRDVSPLLVMMTAASLLCAVWFTIKLGLWGVVFAIVAALLLVKAIIGKPYGAKVNGRAV